MAEVELEQKPDGDEYLQAVLAVTQQMEHLVTTLLSISRTEAGLETAVLDEVDVVQVLNECWSTQQEDAEKKRAKYRFEGPDSAWIHSDPALLSRVLTNLLSNAVSYVPPGGEIRCDIRSENGRVLLDIGNTTHDLRKEDLPHLFEPLWRKEASRSEQAHHGLGLCLVKAYARLLDSSVVADLPHPDWFRITLDLPAAASSRVSEPLHGHRMVS
jgi:signal transduction histidine kinase